ncbi:hypothetical protein D3C83_162790 [compost metagenome]
MAAGLADRVDQERTQLGGELLQLPLFETAQLVRKIDRFQQVVHPVKVNLPARR